MTQTAQINLEKALKDEIFARKVLEMQDLGDVQAAFKTKNVDLTIEEIQQIGDAVKKVAAKKQENPGAELSLDQLEEVAGGGITMTIICCVAAVMAVGMTVGGLLGISW